MFPFLAVWKEGFENGMENWTDLQWDGAIQWALPRKFPTIGFAGCNNPGSCDGNYAIITDESSTGIQSDVWRGVLQSCDFVIDTTKEKYLHFKIGGGPYAIPTGSHTSILSNWQGLTLEEVF